MSIITVDRERTTVTTGDMQTAFSGPDSAAEQISLLHDRINQLLGKTIGPTGEFPDGKLCEDEPGALTIEVTHTNNAVEIHLGAVVSWLALPQSNALQFAMVIRKHALQLNTTPEDN